MQTAAIWEYKGTTMRSSRIEDKDAYYINGFTECDREVVRMTGSKMHYSKEEVDAYFVSCLSDTTRYDFLLFDPQDSLIGECVINEIDEQARSANFRICIFQSKDCGQGVGSWAVQTIRDFAFRELKLHRLSLDVFSFNTRAKKAYEKAGFRVEGSLRDAIWDNGVYADDILMSILEEEWQQLVKEGTM